MEFAIKNPWHEWIVLTPIGKKIFSTKVDSGAMVTFVGITIALAMGIDKTLILSLPPLCDTEYSLSQLIPQIEEITIAESKGGNTLTEPIEEPHRCIHNLSCRNAEQR